MKHTLDSLLKLSETEEGLMEINRTVAKLTGVKPEKRWKFQWREHGSFSWHDYGNMRTRDMAQRKRESLFPNEETSEPEEYEVPAKVYNYTGSLDAAAEAEKTIKGIGCPFDHEEAHRWHDHLINGCIIQSPQVFCGSAPALLRSIAVILTKQEVAE